MERGTDGKFKKGHSGNPGGRPKTKVDYRELFDAVCTDAAWRAIIRKAVKDAREGDWRARQWLSDRDWGKSKQGVVLEGHVGFDVADWEKRARERLNEVLETMEGEREDTSFSE